MLHAIRERLAIKDEKMRAERRERRRAERNAPAQELGGESPERTFSKRAKEAEARAPKQARRSLNLKLDVPLLLILITLLIFGLIMLYSASYDYSRSYYGDSTQMFNRQLIWLGLGLLALVVMAVVDYHIWSRFAVPLLVGTIVLLLVTLIMNQVLNNAVRTLIGRSVQPSEMAKLVMILYLSVWLYAKRERLHSISFGLVPLASMLGIVGGLIFLQPDLSAMVAVLGMGCILFFLAGADMKQILMLLALALVVGWIVIQVHPTGSNRMGEYLAGLSDPERASYHVQRAMESFVKGGFLGAGIGKGVTKLTGLPVPPTDSIFAVIGEETGLVGSILLVCLYLIFLWRGLVVVQRAPDQLGALMASGIVLWIASEAFINMAVMVNVLPFAGNALPFISAGGSNLVVSLAAMGVLLNISRLSVQQTDNGRFFGAVIDLRRRDRRRSVSRSERPAGLD